MSRENIVNRVQLLLERARLDANSTEGELAAKFAARLIAEHAITEDELQLKKKTGEDGIVIIQFDIGKKEKLEKDVAGVDS